MQLSAVCWSLFGFAFFIVGVSLDTKSLRSSKDIEESVRDIKAIFENEMDELMADDEFINPQDLSDAAVKYQEFGAEVAQLSLEAEPSSRLALVNVDAEKVSKIPLNRVLGRQQSQCPNDSSIICDKNCTYRSFDGSCNNVDDPHLGQATSCHRRILKAEYNDGVSSPRTLNDTLPNSRQVCLNVHHVPPEDSNVPDMQLSSLYMAFGQFVDHDLSLTLPISLPDNTPLRCCPFNVTNNEACFPIFLDNDAEFQSNCMNVVRSRPCQQCIVAERQQMNVLTPFIDCSHIYGLTQDQADSLRSQNGDGKLATQFIEGVGELLPRNNNTNQSCGTPNSTCFNTGDTRANQNVQLTSLHTTFVLFHNKVVDNLIALYPDMDSETLYQEGRKFVIATFQHVVYYYYLYPLLGSETMQRYGLDATSTLYSFRQDPRTINEAMVAAFRLHSTVPDNFWCQREDGNIEIIEFGNNFFNVTPFYTGQLICIIRGSWRQPQQMFDPILVPSVNRFLYVRSNATQPALDLCSVNIQRGRDHGIPSYTSYVYFFFGIQVESFEQLEATGLLRSECISQYKVLYPSVNDIDLWSALQCEVRDSSAFVGPVSRRILGEEFFGAKYGDRFFWTHDGEPCSLTRLQKEAVEEMTLERIFCEAHDLYEVALDTFLYPSPIVSCNDPRIPPMDLSGWRQ